MDLGGDVDVVLPRGYDRKKSKMKDKKNKKNITSRVDERNFLNCNGFKDPKRH
jgi:hypothetical protein